ncbi:MAG: carbamoyl phosphate synthase [Actinomycetota bacterium]|nr:carbamoyl phosphate synthase [Actinomycetota bacterium]
MFDRILIANRGEIAIRIARTCRELGVSAVGVYSDVDATARHVAALDDAVHLLGIAPASTYLDAPQIIDAALALGAQAIHPGYGFLSEKAEFAEMVDDAGLTWIGPPADAIRALGDKIGARRLATAAGVPIVPGVTDPVGDATIVRAFADANGYPVAIKASGGGGGRGLKVARSPDEGDDAFAAARREAEAYFSSADVYVERYIENPKHLEVQLLAPHRDEALWLGVRDCSFQRRHQKLIEETPPPLHRERVADMGQAAVSLSKAAGYVNAGTVEMLVDERGDYYFLEVNARLQVEHTVTEEVLGVDLVACQLKVAAGDPLGFTQTDVEDRARGHAIECRINAEDATRGFLPSPGRIDRYVEPDGLGVRVDSGYGAGDELPEAYDSLLAKLIVWGSDRAEARARMLRALDEFEITGVATTIAAHKLLLQGASFIDGTHTTRTIEDGGILDALTSDVVSDDIASNVLMVEGRSVHLWNPAMAASAAAAVAAGSSGDVIAPMHGTVLKILVEPGQTVTSGDAVAVLEAMKMETTLAAPRDGTVARIDTRPGETAEAGQVLAVIE